MLFGLLWEEWTNRTRGEERREPEDVDDADDDDEEEVSESLDEDDADDAGDEEDDEEEDEDDAGKEDAELRAGAGAGEAERGGVAAASWPTDWSSSRLNTSCAAGRAGTGCWSSGNWERRRVCFAMTWCSSDSAEPQPR